MERPKSRVQILLTLAVVLGAVAVPPVRHTLGHSLALLATGQLAQFQQYLRSLGAWAPVVSIALMVAEALLVPVPVTIIMVANGLVFGLWWGVVVSLAGGLAGALAAYAIGRSLGRPVVERFVPAVALREADRLMAKYGPWAIVLERWIPGIPGDPVSYASGMTRLPAMRFFLLTIIGLVPANLVTAFVGINVASDVPFVWWISGWAVVIAGVVTWRIARGRRKPSPLQPPTT